MGFGSEVQPYPPQVQWPVTTDSRKLDGFSLKMKQFIQLRFCFHVGVHMAKLVLDVDETNEKNANWKEKWKE